MPSPNKIWFRKDVGWWMVIGGQRHRLAEGKGAKKLAEQKLHELLAGGAEAPEASTARVSSLERNIARVRCGVRL